MKRLIPALGILFITLYAHGQSQPGNFHFALISDTHIGSSTSCDDLRRTVKDINEDDSLAFVIVSGDITEFGSDVELMLAKQIIDSLNKPWYVIPGNHDTKWSESGNNSFSKIFITERFSFSYGNLLFVGINSGPNMRMSPGQVPRNDIHWLDSLVNTQRNSDQGIVFISHYPLDQGLNNWYEVIDILKKQNIVIALCGHGHSNRLMDLEGIPGIMGRSNLRGSALCGGYNIMSFYGDSLLTISERLPQSKTMPAWASVKLFNHHFEEIPGSYPRPDYSVNTTYNNVKEVWRIENGNDIGSGASLSGRILVTTDEGGFITALNVKNGKKIWQVSTGRKIYSTPSIYSKMAIITVTDGKVLALDLNTGRQIWTFNTGESVVASPVTCKGFVFVAGSAGKCYCLSCTDGRVLWSNDSIIGFVETKPLIHNNMIFFGTWGNNFYALDLRTGKTRWVWYEAESNRNLSPAACVPVVTAGRVFFVAPDRRMTCLTADEGKVIWRTDPGSNAVRESMGVSDDSTMIYAKTMDGRIIGASVSLSDSKIVWEGDTNIGYDISPSVITEMNGVVFVPTDKGIVYAFGRYDEKLLWTHRISSCLINQITPLGRHSALCTSMDGVITRLRF